MQDKNYCWVFSHIKKYLKSPPSLFFHSRQSHYYRFIPLEQNKIAGIIYFRIKIQLEKKNPTLKDLDQFHNQIKNLQHQHIIIESSCAKSFTLAVLFYD
jgi:hypothetical protein